MSFPDAKSLQELGCKVSRMNQQAPGYLYNATRTINATSPEHTQQVKAEIDQMVGLYSILHAIKLFESYWPSSEWGHECMAPNDQKATSVLEPDQLERMLAYRHIRHVAAHGMDGRRVDEGGVKIGGHLADFESVMGSANRLAYVTVSATLITVNPAAALGGLQSLLTIVAQQGIAHAHQYHS